MSGRTSAITGPSPLGDVALEELNALFSAAFSERYRRDGMVGVRVPPLHPRLWRFALEAAGPGAMAWRDGEGRLAAFNLVHVSGTEGWMGPLAVREDLQGAGLGSRLIEAGVTHLRAARCRIIGLETMPRTMDNIGFYVRRGFRPGPLTITVTMPGVAGESPERIGSLDAPAREAALAACTALVGAVRPGTSYAREIALTVRHGIGDCVLLYDGAGRLEGFALYHDVPLVEGRALEELRVLKAVVTAAEAMPRLLALVARQARRSGAARAAVRLQGEYRSLLPTMVSQGARVRWTDLRMHLEGHEEPNPEAGVVLSNWEI